MHPDLVAYVFDALDEPAHAQFESALRTDPELQDAVHRARARLVPLLDAAQHPDAPFCPPPGLAIATLARVAEHICQDLPIPPTATTMRRPSADRSWWRRADLMVAVSIAATIAIVMLPALLHLRSANLQAECTNNLRELWSGLNAYEAQHKKLPDVGEMIRPAAGMVVPMLREAGVLSSTAAACCPGVAPGLCLNVSAHDLERLPDSEFEKAVVQIMPGLAYSLGYREGGQRRGPAPEMPDVPAAQMPLLADAPPPGVGPGNSVNHSGRGQNVVYSDGHVAFKTLRAAGIVPGDDLYLNQANRVAAGLGQHDAVLATGSAVP